MWWYKSPGRRQFSTGTQIKYEASDLRSDPPHIKTKTKDATVNELLDAHLAYMRRRHRASAQDVEWIIKKHIRSSWIGEHVASTLTTRDFERYREEKTLEKLEPTTINRHLSYIRSGYVTGYKRVTPRMVDFIPAFPIVDESYNVRQGFLTFDGYAKVLAELPVSLKPLFVCPFRVSSRKGELKDSGRTVPRMRTRFLLAYRGRSDSSWWPENRTGESHQDLS